MSNGKCKEIEFHVANVLACVSYFMKFECNEIKSKANTDGVEA